MVNETSNQRTNFIYYWWVGIVILILGLRNSVFHIRKNIPTVVGISHRGHVCKYTIYAQLIIIDLHIYYKTLCGGNRL